MATAAASGGAMSARGPTLPVSAGGSGAMSARGSTVGGAGAQASGGRLMSARDIAPQGSLTSRGTAP